MAGLRSTECNRPLVHAPSLHGLLSFTTAAAMHERQWEGDNHAAVLEAMRCGFSVGAGVRSICRGHPGHRLRRLRGSGGGVTTASGRPSAGCAHGGSGCLFRCRAQRHGLMADGSIGAAFSISAAVLQSFGEHGRPIAFKTEVASQVFAR